MFKNIAIIIVFIFIIFFYACSKENSYKANSPYRALVLVPINVNEQTQRIEYAIKEATIHNLTDAQSLDGIYIKMYKGGELKISAIGGSLVSQSSFSKGGSPDINYRIKDEIIVPTDYISFVMLSSYYQFDYILYNLKELTNIDFQSFINSKKIELFFEPKISLEDENQAGQLIYKLNAAYITNQKQFVLFQRSTLELIPLAANLQVLAHEFGHLLFEISFYNNNYDENDRFAKEYVINGINEGWADFTSFVITKSANVMGNVTDALDLSSERFFTQITFTYQSLFNPTQKVCSGSFYCIGTLFAKSLYQIYDSLKENISLKDFYYTVFEALSKTKSTLETLPSSILPAAITPYNENIRFIDYDGAVLGAFFYSLIKNLPAEWKANSCRVFRDNFTIYGFPDNAYSICN